MERTWYYAEGNDRKGPLPEAEIRDLVARGTITATTLVWSEGMPDWVSAARAGLIAVPESAVPSAAASLAPPAAPAPLAPHPTTFAASHGSAPEGLRGWMQFFGVMTILGGAIQCLSCIGAVMGIPMIIAGAAFTGAAAKLDALRGLDDRTVDFLTKLKSGFRILGITMIVSFVFAIIVFAIYAAVIASFLGHMGSLNLEK